MRYFWAGCPVDANFSKPPKNLKQRNINRFRQWNTFLIGKTRVGILIKNWFNIGIMGSVIDRQDKSSGVVV